MADKPKKEVYVMTLDYFFDDYKRPEGSSEVIGIRSDRNSAYKIVLSKEFEKNYYCRGEFTNEEYDKNGLVTKEGKYRLLYMALQTLLDVSDDFIGRWETAKYEAVGDSEFGVMPSGYTANVSSFVIDEDVVDDVKDE